MEECVTTAASEAVRETYRLALQQRLQRTLKTQAEWDRFVGIAKGAAERIDLENASFRSDYQSRLEDARTTVLREHEARHLTYPPPEGAEPVEPLSPDRLDLVAAQRVRSDHAARLRVIREDETDQYNAMREDLRVARQQRRTQALSHQTDRAKEAFNLPRRTPSRQQSQ